MILRCKSEKKYPYLRSEECSHIRKIKFITFLEDSKSRKQFIVFSILTKDKRNSISFLLLLYFITQESKFRSVFGRIEETINCFRDLLTFTAKYQFQEFWSKFQCMRQLASSFVVIIVITKFYHLRSCQNTPLCSIKGSSIHNRIFRGIFGTYFASACLGF